MASSLRIRVLEGSNGTMPYGGVARVCLAPRATLEGGAWPYDKVPVTHQHQGNGIYAADEDPAPGEWMLIVDAKDCSPVTQRLRTSLKDDALRCVPGWKGEQSGDAALAATVAIQRYDVKGKGDEARRASGLELVVRVYPRREAVFFAGVDKWSGTHFIKFAEGHRARLRATGRLDDGAIATMIAVQERYRARTVKARGAGWVELEHIPQPAKTTSAYKPDPAHDLSIVDLYRHLHDVGSRYPGTILEAGIFGHAFIGGPVVWNTYDESPDPALRDPADMDGRVKDWSPNAKVVHQEFKALLKAFAKDGLFKSWGCNANHPTLARAGKALDMLKKGAPRDQFFQVDWDEGMFAGHENTTLDMVRWQFNRELTRYSYNSVASRSLPCSCYGAPPGMGANFGARDGNLAMFINGTVPQHKKAYEYYEKEFGIGAGYIDGQGYLDFTAFKGFEPVRPAFRTERWYTDTASGYQRALALPIFYSALWRGVAQLAKVTPASGLVDPAQKGHLYALANLRADRLVQTLNTDSSSFLHWVVMLEKSPAQDVAFYVQENGSTYILDRPTGSSGWKLRGQELPVQEGIYKHGDNGVYISDVTQVGTLKAGVLREGEAEYRW